MVTLCDFRVCKWELQTAVKHQKRRSTSLSCFAPKELLPLYHADDQGQVVRVNTAPHSEASASSSQSRERSSIMLVSPRHGHGGGQFEKATSKWLLCVYPVFLHFLPNSRPNPQYHPRLFPSSFPAPGACPYCLAYFMA